MWSLQFHCYPWEIKEESRITKFAVKHRSAYTEIASGSCPYFAATTFQYSRKNAELISPSSTSHG